MSCERCGGFKVFDYFDGPFHCSGYRCINCGAITDMRIAMATQTRTVVPPRRTKNLSGGRHLLRPMPGLLIRVKLNTSHESTPRPDRAGCRRTPARRRVPELNSLGTNADVYGVFWTGAFMRSLLSDPTDSPDI